MLFRYAPTPSGFLHLGNGVNLTLTYLLARAMGSPILLRIDDLDSDRKRPDYVADVFRSLDYLGLTYEQGPTGPDDFEQQWSQRHRMPLYEQTLTALVETGVVYASKFSRQQVLTMGDTAIDRMRAQQLPLSMSDVVWRARVPDNEPFTDFVVRKRDGVPAYQIASLTDDIHFGVTHFVRGNDLRESTAMQQYLAHLLGYEKFAAIPVWHHALLTDAQGQKLSKSAGSTSLKAICEGGKSPVVVYQEVARLVGLPVEAVESLEGLERAFVSTTIAPNPLGSITNAPGN